MDDTKKNKIDILSPSLRHGVNPTSIVETIGPENLPVLRNKQYYYDNFSNKSKSQKDNPNAPTTEEIDQIYDYASKVAQIHAKGYYRPREINSFDAALQFKPEYMNPIIMKNDKADLPYISTDLPVDIAPTMNLNRDALESDSYYEPDRTSPTGYKKIAKTKTWKEDALKPLYDMETGKKQSFQFVYEPDPTTDGMTKILVKRERDMNIHGYDNLHNFSSDKEYSNNYLVSTLRNIVSAFPRLGKAVKEIDKGFTDVGYAVSGAAEDIFSKQDEFENYVNVLKGTITDAKEQKILDDALSSGDKDKMLDAFNYIEYTKPLSVKDRLFAMRTPDHYNKMYKEVNDQINRFDALTYTTPEELSQGAFSNVSNFAYNVGGILADQIPQFIFGGALGKGFGAAAKHGSTLLNSTKMAGAVGKASKAGSYIGSGFVGGSQAVGTLVEEMENAGFDKRDIAKVFPIAMTFIPLTEGLMSGAWMHRWMKPDIIESYRLALRESLQEVYKKGGGKLAAGQAMDVAKDSYLKLWGSRKFRDMVEKSYLLKELPSVMATEGLQENLEQFLQNGANYFLNHYKPEYYGDVIDSGVNDMFGSEGVFNGREIMETFILSAISAGMMDAARGTIQGQFKGGKNNFSKRNIAARAWASEEAAKGNLGQISDMLKQEVSKDVNMFGRKDAKLTDLGAENIVITDPAVVARLKKYGLGTDNVDSDGKINGLLIDNVADAAALEVINNVDLVQEVSSKNGLDGSTLNSKMLHELIDVNQLFMSHNAIDISINLKSMKEELDALNKIDTSTMDESKKKEHDASVSKLTEAMKDQNEKLSFYTSIEEGTKFSRAVNDRIKTLMFTNDLAEKKTKETFDVGNLDMKKKNHYSEMKKNWTEALNHKYKYSKVRDLMDNLLKVNTIENEERIKRIDDLNKPDTEGVKTKFSSLTNSITSLLENDDKDFIENVDKIFNTIQSELTSINNDLNVSKADRSDIETHYNEFTNLYRITYERLKSLNNEYSSVEESDLSFIEDENTRMMLDAFDNPSEYENSDTYKSLPENERKQYDDAKRSMYYKKMLSDKKDSIDNLVKSSIVGLSYSVYDPNNERSESKKKELEDLKKEITSKDSLKNIIDEMHANYKAAAESVNPNIEDKTNNPYTGQDPAVVESQLQIYEYVRELIENGQEVAQSLNGKDQFNKHSSSSEQELIDLIANSALDTDMTTKIKESKGYYDEFRQNSGLSNLSSLVEQQKRGVAIMANTVSNLKHIISVLGKDNFSSTDVDALDKFVLNKDNSKRKNEFNEEEIKSFNSVEVAIAKVIDTIKSKKLLTDDNLQKLLKPVIDFNNNNVYNEASSSAIGFDGFYEKDANVIYDVTTLREDASKVDFNDESKNIILSSFNNARKVNTERIKTYVSLLIQMDSNISVSKLSSERLKAAKSGVNISTYEQRFVEDTLVGFFSNSRVHALVTATDRLKIKANEDTKLNQLIDFAMIIPGDYGTGKTQHVVKTAIALYEAASGKFSKKIFISPSDRLKKTHEEVFSGDNEYLMFDDLSTIEKPSDGETHLLVIDEGSLLDANEINTIKRLGNNSGNKIRIIILADLNQMRDTDSMKAFSYKYPQVLSEAFKTITLTEQFSTGSPMITTHAKFWKDRASELKPSRHIADLPMAYSKTVNGNKYGFQYSSSDTSVILSFNSAQTDSKALIFENQEHLDTVIANSDESVRESIKANDDKIFFIHYDRVNKKRLIQGLRVNEVYIVPDFKTMFFHTDNGGIDAGNDFVAIYTAIGRASKYVNMNIGVDADKFTTDNPLTVPSVGDHTGTTRIFDEKMSKMRNIAEDLYKSMSSAHSTAASPEGAEGSSKPGAKKPVVKTPAKVTGNKTTGQVVITDSNNDEIAVKYTIEEKDDEFNLKISIVVDGKKKTITDEYTFKFKPGEINIKTLSQSLYDEYIEELEKAGQAGGTGKKRASKKGVKKAGVKEKKEPKKRVKKTKDSAVLVEPLSSAFMSQSREWDAKKAIYSTSHFVNVSLGNYSSKELNQARLIHSFLLEHAHELGLTLKLKHLENAFVMSDSGVVNEDSLIITVENNKKVISQLRSSEYYTNSDAEMKEALDKFIEDTTNDNSLELFLDVSVMARPLSRPVGKVGSTVLTHSSFKVTTLENAITTINNGFDPYLNDLSINADVRADLKKQKEVQIEIAKFHITARSIAGPDGIIDIPLNVSSMGVTTQWDRKVDTNVDDFIANNPNFIFDTDEDGSVTITFDKWQNDILGKKRNVIKFRTKTGETSYALEIKSTKLSDAKNKNRRNRLMSEDKAELSEIATTSKPFHEAKDLYIAFEEMFKDSHVYSIIMGNKSNVRTLRSDNKNRNVANNIHKYIEFKGDGKYINVKGENLIEKVANLKALIEEVYNGSFTDELYDSMKGIFDENNELVGYHKEPDQIITLNDKVINNPHFFIGVGNVINSSKDESSDSTSSISQKKNNETPLFEEYSNEKTEYINKEQASAIVSQILGASFAKNHLTYVSGLINHNGKKAFGMAYDGDITLAETESGIKFTTPFHEALHIVFESILNPFKAKRYEHLARKIAYERTGKILNGVDLKEFMANEFAKKGVDKNYSVDDNVITDDMNVSKSEMSLWERFKYVMNNIINMFLGYTSLDQIFNDILAGEYQYKSTSNNDYILFDESDNTEDVVYDDKEEDAVSRFVELKRSIDRMFPGNRNLLQRFINVTRLQLIQDSPLGNKNYSAYSSQEDLIKYIIESRVAKGLELGERIVEVNNGGKITSKKISELVPEEYDKIEATDVIENKKGMAQAYYRTWFLYKEENMKTAIQNILPEYDPESNTIAGGKLYDGTYDSNDLDPHRDGFSSQLKFQLQSIPVVSRKGFKTVVDYDNPVFVDFKLMVNILNEASYKAAKYLEEMISKGHDISYIEALDSMLTYMLDANSREVGPDGRYLSPISEAIASFQARFFGDANTTFIDTDNIAYHGLLGIAENMYKEHGVSSDSAYIGRANKIMSFLSMMSANGASKVITRNMGVSIEQAGNTGSYFYTVTEYSNSPFENAFNRIKNAFDSKMSNGVIASKKIAKSIKENIIIQEEDATYNGKKYKRTVIYVGKTKVPFIVFDKKVMFHNEGNEPTETTVKNTIAAFNIIRKLIGLDSSVLPDSVIKDMIINPNYTKLMYDMGKSTVGADFTVSFKDQREFLAAFIGDVIFAFKAQVDPFDFEFTYIKDGKEVSYKGKGNSVIEHRDNINNILADGKVKEVTLNGEKVKSEDLLSKLVDSKTFPYLNKLHNFVKATGSYSRGSNDKETLTGEGINIPTPSQLYKAIDVIAYKVSSMTGNFGGSFLYRPDGKKQHTVQGRNMINRFIDGCNELLRITKKRLADNPDIVKRSVLHDKNGKFISPYFIKDEKENKPGSGRMILDHIGDFFGASREYSKDIKVGNTKLTPLDYVAVSINAFMKKALSKTRNTEIIVTPTTTLSDTGKVYFLHHRILSKKGDAISTHGKKMRANYAVALEQVQFQAMKVERKIELSRERYFNLIDDLNKLVGKNVFIKPVDNPRKGSNDLTMANYLAGNRDFNQRALATLSEDGRKKVIEFVEQSQTVKGADVIIKDGNFFMGDLASDMVKGLTFDDGINVSIYSKMNRDIILSKERNGIKYNEERILKTIFREDFENFCDYIESIGFEPKADISKGIVSASDNLNGRILHEQFYDPTDILNVNEALFAFYMMYHISNNAFEDISSNTSNYKDVSDLVKRLGPHNTPKTHLNVNVRVDDIFIGSLPEQSYYIPIKDVSVTPHISDKMGDTTIEESFNGQSFVLPLYKKMFDISSGGREYSVGGSGSVLKTLYIKHDPITGYDDEVKHASKHITDNDFETSSYMRKMVLDGFEEQDRHLDKSLLNGDYADFSWKKRFIEYYNETLSMDKAVDALFRDMVNSQFEENGEALYKMLAASVAYGYNPESTIKTRRRSINTYNPLTGERPDAFATETMDNRELGIILNSEQPIDDSKKQSPYQQQEPFFGISEFKIEDKGYGTNPAMAISKIRAEIYEIVSKDIANEIGKTVPENKERGVNMPLFSEINWFDENSGNDKDLSYAIAQFEWYMRDKTRSGLANSKVQGNYIDMLSSADVTIQVPQMRNIMVHKFRNLINKEAVKRGMTGMRTVQVSGVFIEMYELEGDPLLFTYKEALEYAGLKHEGMDSFEKNEAELLKVFKKRGLNDMRVENGETKAGETVMPFAFATKLGLRKKGVNGATKSESLRDMFSLNVKGKKINIHSMSVAEIGKIIRENATDALFQDSFLVRKAIENMEKDGAGLTSGSLATYIESIRDDIKKSLRTYANRVPSNRLGSGSILDIVAFHDDGNESYIPVGMTLLNDSDFDIDQLSVYLHKLNKDGMLSDDKLDKLLSQIQDIVESVYMAKENQDNIFVNSSIKDIQAVGNTDNGTQMTINHNTPLANVKSYLDNKSGAGAIGIMANTLSAAAWLSVLSQTNKNIIPDDSLLKNIVSDYRNTTKGSESLVIQIGNWLQAALDNNKNNTIGNYGITEQAVPIAAIIIANGPRIVNGKRESEQEFFEYIKEFFTNYTIANTFREASKGDSLHYSKAEHALYPAVAKHLSNVTNNLKTEFGENVSIAASTEEELLNYALEHLLPYINAYAKDMGITEYTKDMFKATDPNVRAYMIDDFNRLIFRYTDVEGRNSKDKKERALVEKYLEMKTNNKRLYRYKGLKDAQVYLKQLKKYIIEAESLRQLSTVISLRNGINSMDPDFHSKWKQIELSFGMSMKDIVSGKTVTQKEYLDYFMENSTEYREAIEKNEASGLMIIEKAMMVFDSLNLPEVIKDHPMLKVYLKQMFTDKNILKNTFIVDSDMTKNIEKDILKHLGLVDWKFSNQRQAFLDAINEVILDNYFAEEFEGNVSISIPMKGANGYVSNTNNWSNMDLSNIFERQAFTLQFPNFVMALKENYTTPFEMEMAFRAISPDYIGISNAFFDEQGFRTGNRFMNNIDLVGSSERQYIGIIKETNKLSDDDRRLMMDDFDKLPYLIQKLFTANEIIVNKLSYRAGSIIDIIGLKPYKDGISRAFEKFNVNYKYGASFNNNEELMERFVDYVALTSGATKYVKKDDVDLSDLEYLHTFDRTMNTNFTVREVYKNTESGHSKIKNITSRAGLSMRENNITNHDTIPITAEMHEALMMGNGSVATRTFPKGHGYKNGVYITDTGIMVKLRHDDNFLSVTLTRDDSFNNVAAKTKDDMMNERSNESSIDSLTEQDYLRSGVDGKERLDSNGFESAPDVNNKTLSITAKQTPNEVWESNKEIFKKAGMKKSDFNSLVLSSGIEGVINYLKTCKG